MPYALAAVFALTGLLLVWLGYLIRVRRMTHLIAGYDRERVQDENGLARWVGGYVLAMGVLGVLAGLGAIVWSGATGVWASVFAAAVVVLTVVAAWGARRFERHPAV